MLKDSSPRPRGRMGLWSVEEVRDHMGRVLARHVYPITFKLNQIQYTWGFIAAQTIGMGKASYKISAMYIEFENVADPEDPVSIPTFGRDEGVEYFDGLYASGTRDFLRVPLWQAPLLGVTAGYEDYFDEGQGNKLTFYAQTAGLEGVHGKTFSHNTNSKVCGACLVATPVFSDPTQDVILARAYYDVEEQTVKEPSKQLGVSWEIDFL